jgi:hypothetical protein
VASSKKRTDCVKKFLLPPLVLLAFALLRSGGAGGRAADVSPSLEARITGRDFPSVFQAWNPADNLPQEDRWTTVARHDLVFHAPDFFGLQWDRTPAGTATGFTPESVAAALALRKRLLTANPHLLLLAEIRYRDAHRSYLPPDSLWWKRDATGKFVMGWEEGGYILLDLANPAYQRQVAAQAKAAVSSGVFDGIMLDWWQDDDDRLALIRQIRAAIGPGALILANANDHTTPRTAPYVNGYFMECYRSKTVEDWQRIASTLAWAESHLRRPRIDCLEIWTQASRDDLDRMRATTALGLTTSDGYVLFSDPNPLPTPDHLHNWYPFWNKSLGKPRAPGKQQPNGTRRREFTRGTVVYNPPGNAAQTITFPEERRSLATGKTAYRHTLGSPDGDLFLRPAP